MTGLEVVLLGIFSCLHIIEVMLLGTARKYVIINFAVRGIDPSAERSGVDMRPEAEEWNSGRMNANSIDVGQWV